MIRPIWIRKAEHYTATVGDCFLTVYHQVDGRWGWYVWRGGEGTPFTAVYSWPSGGSRRFRFLATRDALREIARQQGVRG